MNLIGNSKRITNIDRMFTRRAVLTTPFSPNQVASLKLWLDASQIVGLNDGDEVVTWSDLSGNANHMSSAATKQPTYQVAEMNGKPVVLFDGVNDYLKATFTLIQPITVFVVGKHTSLTGLRVMFDGQAGSTFLGYTADVGDRISSFAGVDITNGPIVTENVAFVAEFKFNGASSDVQLDGAAVGGNAGTGGFGAFTLGIYGDLANYPFEGPISEVLVYNAALSAGNVQTVNAYLKAKWGTP